MKKSILVILIVLLAFSVWSVMAFGKAKRDEGVKQTAEVEKAEPAPVDLPEVVLPKPHPVRPTAENFDAELATKGRTPEMLESLKGEVVPTDVESAEKAPYYCRVRNQPDGAYYQPGGNPYLYCWGQIGLATYLDLDHNYYSDCPYPLYPFEVVEIGWQIYASDTCTIVNEARVWSVDNSGGVPYPLAELCTSDILSPVVTAHPGAWAYITVPLQETCCVYEPFFAVMLFDNSDDFNDTDYCAPMYIGYALSPVFDGSGGNGQSYWNPFDGTGGSWYDVVLYGMWSGALRVEAFGYTADQNDCPDPVETWYYKDGMPDFYQINAAFPNNGAAFCGPTAGANSIWWFSCVQGDFPPSWGGCVEGVDDISLTLEIAAASGTDPFLGTECDLLQLGIINTIIAHGGWWFSEATSYAPEFWPIQMHLRDCNDVILLLGFWQTADGGATWYRFGGHFVTLAGVDIFNLAFAFSDPFTTPAGYDIYYVAWPSISPGGFLWLPDYVTDWVAFQGQNFRVEHQPYLGTYDPGLPVYVEIEQEINVAKGEKYMTGYVEGSQIYEVDNNFGGIADVDWYVNFNGDGATYVNGGYYGSYILGTYQVDHTDHDVNCSYGDYHPTFSFDPLAAPTWDSFTIAGAAGDYWIEQGTFKFKHTDYDIFITEYVFGFWVPEGGTKDCELAIEHVFVLENLGESAVIGLQSGMINDIDIGDNACEVDFDAQHNSMWMYELVNDTLVFGMTKKPAIVGDYAVTGWGLLNGARIYDGQYNDSLFIWMQSGTWQVDDYGVGDDKSLLLADVPFDLQPGQVRIEKWLKWGYPGVIAPGGDADWRHFLYNILHQEGFYRGDVNKDGFFNINDVIWMVNYLFKGGALPIEFKSQMDVNCDGETNVNDVIYSINYLFKGGLPPIDKNRFFLESPYVDPLHKDAYVAGGYRTPGLWGEADWKGLGQ